MGSKQEITCPYCGTKYKFVDAIDYLSDLKD
jgi:redox-regulated HSP33 family molecular chaperone